MEFTRKTALLIVDMINDFARPDGALYVPDTEKIVPNIADLIGQARREGGPVIFIADAHDPGDKEFEKWGPHAIAGTEGSMIIEELRPAPGEPVILKKSFSSFFETDLEKELKGKGIEHLVITGTVTNICVYATAMEATLRGYKIAIPRNAVAGLYPEEHSFALKQMEEILGAEIV